MPFFFIFFFNFLVFNWVFSLGIFQNIGFLMINATKKYQSIFNNILKRDSFTKNKKYLKVKKFLIIVNKRCYKISKNIQKLYEK